MYPQGAAICGAEDISGQLWEWYQNKYSKTGELKVLRGGAFYSYANYAACAIRDNLSPFSDYYDRGFRVVVASSPIAPSDL